MRLAVIARALPSCRPWARAAALLALGALGACGGGGGAPADVSGINPGGPFAVRNTLPANHGLLYLNEALRIDFTTPVDLDSVDLNTVAFQVFDELGRPLSEQPSGRFELQTSPGDPVAGRRLAFVPHCPTNDGFDNGGFRPGRTYLVQLVGGDVRLGNVLRDKNGRSLATPLSFDFRTVTGTTPAQLFADGRAGGPRRVGFEITPTPGAGGASLNPRGLQPVELRLLFDQQLNPHSSNVPVQLDTDPLRRASVDKGAVYLEYDDPETAVSWIPAAVELDNDSTPPAIVLRPVGVLPNHAEVRVIVEPRLQDIAGESNLADPRFDRVFASFATDRSYTPQFDALVEDFLTGDDIDTGAVFVEPQAEVGAGFVRAGFEFDGGSTTIDFEPITQEVVLDTDFTQVIPSNAPPMNVSGGVFRFRNVHIPAGCTVTGTGRNPMVILCSGSCRIDGLISARGGNGQMVTTVLSARVPAAGGPGGCGGGNGGIGSVNGSARTMLAQAGYGPGQRPGGGGGGGRIACAGSCYRGSGGGGGGMATQGDPHFPANGVANLPTSFQQKAGLGGQGCQGSSGSSTRTLAGGAAGPAACTDSRLDNDFLGVGIDLHRQLRIFGELTAPQAGGGGGGGGDLAAGGGCNPLEPNWGNDSKGGGGGGGGGVVIIKALGDIVVGPTGRITADGGHGGGGEQVGSCSHGGGGGGGAGGMVVLAAGNRIELHAKGVGNSYTFTEHNYDFCVSADGGVCLTGSQGTASNQVKYAANGAAIPSNRGETYDVAPLGGLGGTGIVQLMAPPGDPTRPGSNADQTNTVLDDGIDVYLGGVLATGMTKQRLLSWRGFPDQNGQWVDDSGTPTNIGAGGGDIRPTPILLPVPFSSKSRVRSKWIDTGATHRRALAAADLLPRGVVEEPGQELLAGPRYLFAGTRQDPVGPAGGYAAYAGNGPALVPTFPALLPGNGVEVAAASADARYDDQPAYRVDLIGAPLAGTPDRFRHAEAELSDAAGRQLASLRVLGHDDRTLWLDTGTASLPAGVARLQLRLKTFLLQVDGVESFGRVFQGASTLPRSNVRIGFAFSADPGDPEARFPLDPNAFVYDLVDPAVQEAIRTRHLSFVQWDVLFDLAYPSTVGALPPASPDVSAPRPELRWLRLPFRY